MQGIIGLALVIIGLVLVYDVVAGKAQSIVDLFNGQAESASSPPRQVQSEGYSGGGGSSVAPIPPASSGSGLGVVTV